MSIDAISGSPAAAAIKPSAIPGAPRSAAEGARSKVSPTGQLFGELAKLQQSDPDKFKGVMADVAKQLNEAAAQTSGAQAELLTKRAAQFQQAAQTGQLPTQASGAHHHHHASASGAPSASSNSSSIASAGPAAQAYGSREPKADVASMVQKAMDSAGI